MNPTPDMNDDALERLLRASGQLESAPPDVIARAIGLWKAPKAGPADGLLRRVLAVLSFDSAGSAPLAFGLRSSSGATRQLLFAVDGHDIDLRITPAAGSRGALWTVSGQVLGPDLGATAELTAGDFAATTALNDMAEFRFEEVPRGACRLLLRAADHLIELPPIQIPPAD